MRKLRGEASEKKQRPQIIRLTEKETNDLAQKPPDEVHTISEKVLLASVAEKDRISEIEVIKQFIILFLI